MAVLRHNSAVALLALCGLMVSLYCVHVQQHLERHLAYKPYCDIAPSMMCSKVALSPYSHMLSLFGLAEPHGRMDVANGHLGVAFYAFMLTYPFGKQAFENIYFLGTTTALVVSGYLCYLVYSALSVVSIISASIVIVNALLFITIFRQTGADTATAEEISDRLDRGTRQHERPETQRREEKKVK
ncbi:vitamin k epoxide reductase family protein [Toxoplasma gondii TgCatPRC2]|uniref:vitamin-K-epoxide reductase (warfarin-sensitive) n=15 Tax=Toxoplasma gondii TaxID=5811 RepID=B9PU89_TOXGV|nr:vitamin k epoxide reductase family protein [Toxoplasma gondii ME49]EPR61513.1 vitamin k epoxide reductase family protein [Toxoplasma gondii GT1]ESS33122.1 vitamin k epoxide reductase family protein [Toxoplasma gondii VEG]KAF4642805.1 vitamin k epoxide reductase family protein [Toxoplasma gondii]KFG37906.1 vitamin k epoxide reductase family protein [Toxoplasma gondii GAB2-2007-GAL-DOM2]KFG39386.1 vitamin k epoxide reductase family protein [Toxoplasma gondii FOU]KFG46232.1 vitamin k epoxide |eukprot:XP_002367654.1 vitamin k epoxide reductase family protein [Toxoplasma gondii ME49]